jgi:hypothetical protein
VSGIASAYAPWIPWIPADNGLLAATGDPESCRDTAILIAGTVYLRRIPVRGGITASNLCVCVTTAGSNTGGSAGTFAGLIAPSGALLTGSADVAGDLTSTGFQALPLTTPQNLAAYPWVWGVLLANLGTTQPTMLSIVSQTGQSNVNLAAAAYRSAVNGTLQTALPAPLTPAGNTATNRINLWMGVT